MEDIIFGGMYVVIPPSVADDVHLRERSKLVYGRIVQLAHTTGFCYASNDALLKILTHKDPKTGKVSTISERTLQSILAELRDHGHIHMDIGPVPCPNGKSPVFRRRIFVGQQLAEMPSPDRVKKISPSADSCADGVKKSAPPYKISKNNTSKNIPPIVPQGTDAQILFERFWKAYPKKRDKERARRAWKKLNPDMELCFAMSAALERQKRSEEWQKEGGQYIPYPSKWLNGRRWEDEPDEAPSAPYDEEGCDGI